MDSDRVTAERPSHNQLPAQGISWRGSPSPQASVHCTNSMLGEDDQLNQELSNDEGIIPDKLTFMGLFCPSLFRSFLHKAKTILHWQTNMKSKWRLASAPYKSSNLFGEALTLSLSRTRIRER